MGDDTLAQAVQRIQIATKPAAPLHLRYELKITDYKGKAHAGTYETWSSKDGLHTEIHTDAYSWSDLLNAAGVWANENGLRPLRIMEFAEVHVMYRSVLAMAMRGDQKLKPRTVDGVALVCGGQDDRGSVCFDPATGYVALIIKDQERVAYEDWKQVGSEHLAGTVRKSFGKHELFEAKLVEASDKVSPDAFAVPAGATQEPAGTRIDEQRGLVFSKEPHPQLPPAPTQAAPPPMVAGQAVVRVWVDQKGQVSKAQVEDADDKESADAGYAHATLLVYAPYQENGKPASFETSYYMHGMGGFGGGMGMGRGGRGGGGGMSGGGGESGGTGGSEGPGHP
jgi:uncharacterized membrane protein YgcG